MINTILTLLLMLLSFVVGMETALFICYLLIREGKFMRQTLLEAGGYLLILFGLCLLAGMLIK